MHRIPYLGAMPFLRGLGDDKSVSKLVCKHAGVPTAAWFCYRKGGPVLESDLPASREGRWVIKPNASSASWGISDAFDWAGVANAIADIHGQGHDAIVEPYLDGYDVQCAFITINNDPIALPMLWYEREDTQRLWTYYEKRDLVQNTEKAALKRFDDSDLAPKIEEMATKVAHEKRPRSWPFVTKLRPVGSPELFAPKVSLWPEKPTCSRSKNKAENSAH